ncbi:response regulator transcription factor [Rhodanobacter sp. 7MK24]|uniref:response regulator transcription factor n=1 Tax=Rhodanobacter sp. 7MK24 TaxID=2775922 RepID=UPI0017862A4D|nr:response regulator transcription factor [Rhodanobacter sp. 7MK24]MBD8881830.1 response regulator transcription factor [Rhodanobacter sp. 7MK24]
MSSADPTASTESEGFLRLVLLEDDDLLREHVLAPKLRRFGFEVRTSGSMAEMSEVIGKMLPDIVLLDIGLPDGDGFEVARGLRARSPGMGIVMLTGRSESVDRIRGLTEGADAYLAKPVEIDVLVATLHSVARRLKPHAPDIAGMWHLSSDNWILVSPLGGRVTLTKTERLLLEEFMRHLNQVVSREILIGVLADDVLAFDPHRLDSMIHRLRRKVLATLGIPLPLDAVHGAGYLLAA